MLIVCKDHLRTHPMIPKRILNIYSVTSIVFLVGILGLSSDVSRPLFIKLVPLNFLFLFFVFIYSIPTKTITYSIGCIVVFVAGFGVEVLGVMTGKIFGNYWYGPTLGYKIWDVPVVMGINWVIVLSGANFWAFYVIRTYYPKLLNRKLLVTLLVITIASLLMTGLDAVIEPVAMKLNFWQWSNGIIPKRNYLGWFVVSVLFNVLWIRICQPEKNTFAGYLFFVQLVFFLLLNVTL